MEKTIEYGTYYGLRGNDGTFSIIRILTAGNYGVHYAIYASDLKQEPTLKDIPANPIIGHIPQDNQALFSWDMFVLKHNDLVTADLEGFLYYVEAQGVEQGEIKREIDSIIEFSKSGKSLTIKN